jgi:hypothetical protein
MIQVARVLASLSALCAVGGGLFGAAMWAASDSAPQQAAAAAFAAAAAIVPYVIARSFETMGTLTDSERELAAAKRRQQELAIIQKGAA